jgi:WD40 repeat protein
MAVDPTKVRELNAATGDRALLACRFDPKGETVVCGGMNTKLMRCGLAEQKFGKPTHVEAHKSWVAALAYSLDGSRLFSADYAGRIRCSDPRTDDAKLIWGQDAHAGWIRALAVSPDGKFVASGGNDKLVHVWNTSDGTPVRTLVGHADHVYSLAFHPRTGRLVSADLKGALKEWDIGTGLDIRNSTLKEFFAQQQELRLGGVRALAFDAAGKQLVCGGMSGFGSIGDGIGAPTIVVVDWETGEAKQTGLPKEPARTFVTGAAFHADGFVVAATGGLDRGYLLFWKLGQKEKEAFFQFKLPESAWGMDFHAAKNLIATAHHDTRLRLYELPPAGA